MSEKSMVGSLNRFYKTNTGKIVYFLLSAGVFLLIQALSPSLHVSAISLNDIPTTRLPDFGPSVYLTTSTDKNINGDTPTSSGTKETKFSGYNELHFVVYTTSRKQTTVKFNPVNRKVNTRGDQKSCVAQYDVLNSSNGSKIDTLLIGNPNSEFTSCNNDYPFTIPSWVFRPLIYDGRSTGLYEARITLQQIPRGGGTIPVHQSSFGLYSEDGSVRFGLQGESYINAYTSLTQTSGADFSVRFRPPCSTKDPSFQFVFDDVQEGEDVGYTTVGGPRNLRQSTSAYLSINPSSPTYTHVENLGDRAIFPPVMRDGRGVPREITATFHNIMGGNGIGMYLPYDTANFYLNCPGPDKNWTLDNQTQINPGIGAYDNRGTQSQKQQKAKAAYQQARFRHSVQNKGPDTATAAEQRPSSDKGSRIQYRVKRGNSNTWHNSQNGNTDNAAWQDKSTRQASTIAPNNQFFVNDDGSSSYSIPRSDDLAYLINGRTPVIGDTYCERVVTNPNIMSGITTSGSTTSGSENCIVLGNQSQTCFDWNVEGSGTIKKLNEGGIDLGLNVEDAWVNDTYAFDYTFWKTGHAENTSDIAFRHVAAGWAPTPRGAGVATNPGPTTSIGNNPIGGRYGQLTIRPENGGQWASDAADWAPDFVVGGTDCAPQGGDATYEPYGPGWLNVYVPYYYHLTSAIDAISDTTQQGEDVNITLRADLPGQDTQGNHEGDAANDQQAGRFHTWTEPKNWKLMEFKTNDDVKVRNALQRNKSGDGTCGNIAAIVASAGATATDCSDRKGETVQFKTPEAADPKNSPLTYNRPGDRGDPVGTKICYVGAIERPTTDDGGPAWRYSNVQCTTIVKTPKVQFQNGDLTVGRFRSSEGANAGNECKTPLPSAPIQTAGVPSVIARQNPADSNLYGSWIEYGAFATGAISGFGSAATPTNLNNPPHNPTKLTFGNQSGLGQYSYGASSCLQNQFEKIDESKGYQLKTVEASNLRLDQLPGDKTKDVAFTARGDNITVSPTPTKTYKARVTIEGASDYGNEKPGDPMVPAQIRVSVGDGAVAHATTVNMDSEYPATKKITAEVDLGPNGYNGPRNFPGNPAVDIQFINNNANEWWERVGPPQMKDRNLFLKKVQIQWIEVEGGSERVIGDTGEKTVLSDGAITRSYNPAATVPIRCLDNAQTDHNGMLFVPLTKSDYGKDAGYCTGVSIYQTALGFPGPQTPPPVLNDDFDGFKGRDIILYARKTNPTASCNASSGGTIRINTDILYKRSGFANIGEIPRIVLLADCDIIISDVNHVNRVDAWLVAGRNIKTCESVAKTVSQCPDQLQVNGLIQANKLLLWRTYGADLQTGQYGPAEVFNFRPDQLLSDYNWALKNGKVEPVTQIDLPPRY